MDDGALLLDAILANPAEDTPRLMYADWLDGRPVRLTCPECRGDGGSATYPDGMGTRIWNRCPQCGGDAMVPTDSPDRAEFVRGQVEMANWRPYVPPAEILEIAASGRLYAPMAAKSLDDMRWKHVGRLKFLQDRTAELLARHEFAWAAPLGDIGFQANSTWVPDCEWQFHRGFVSQIRISCADFIKHAAAIFAAHPVTQVLTEAAPNWQDGGGLDFGWFRAGDFAGNFSEGTDADPADGVLPAVLFDAIVPHPTGTVVTHLLKLYPTPELALDALTDGLLKFGRAAARAKRAAAVTARVAAS